MSQVATSWARAQRAGGSGRKSVLMILAHLADRAGHAQASVAEIAAAAEISAGVARDHLDHLAALGLIERIAAHRGDGGRAPNRYVLAMPARKARPGRGDGCVESGAASGCGNAWGRA